MQIQFLSHWDPYAVHSLEAAAYSSYCSKVEWFWWDWSLSQRPTGFLQCFDGVGWVIWPVKIVPEMTYLVSSGTLTLYSRVVDKKFKVASQHQASFASRPDVVTKLGSALPVSANWLPPPRGTSGSTRALSRGYEFTSAIIFNRRRSSTFLINRCPPSLTRREFLTSWAQCELPGSLFRAFDRPQASNSLYKYAETSTASTWPTGRRWSPLQQPSARQQLTLREHG